MRIKTEIGQIAITAEDDQYVFTPTLKAMGDIASPDKIIDMLVLLGTSGYKQIPAVLIGTYLKLTTKELWYAATRVLECCCDRDTNHLWGYYIGLKYHPSVLPSGVTVTLKNIITLGRALIEAGVVGRPIKTKNSKQEEVTEWHVDDYITLAMSQLNMTKSDAEQLTIIQLQRALDLLNPEKEEDKQPKITKADDDAMERAMRLMNQSMGVK